MMNARTISSFAFSVMAFTTFFGCSHYYKVTDPSSGKVYYTKEVNQVSGGALRFKDERTGDKMTLQNSDVKEIDERDYRAGMVSQVKPKPAPKP